MFPFRNVLCGYLESLFDELLHLSKCNMYVTTS